MGDQRALADPFIGLTQREAVLLGQPDQPLARRWISLASVHQARVDANPRADLRQNMSRSAGARCTKRASRPDRLLWRPPPRSLASAELNVHRDAPPPDARAPPAPFGRYVICCWLAALGRERGEKEEKESGHLHRTRHKCFSLSVGRTAATSLKSGGDRLSFMSTISVRY